MKKPTNRTDLLWVLTLALGLAVPASAGGSKANPDFYGKSLGEWTGDWWNWALSATFAETPLGEEGAIDCGHRQVSKKLWFLAGNFGGVSDRSCTVPRKTALLFPLVNGVAWAPEDGMTEADLRAVAPIFTEPATGLFCTIDGEPCTNFNLLIRTQSTPFVLEVPEGSLLTDFGLPAGDRDPAISDGYWVLLPPLDPTGPGSASEHVIHFGGSIGPCDAPDFSLDVTYTIEVD